MDAQKLKWSEIVVSALLIFVISFVITFVVSSGYSFIVGFQTRGDMELMTERMIAFTESLGFRAFVTILPALVAFWRSKKIAMNVPEAPVLNALVVAVGWFVIRLIAGILWPPFEPVRIVIELALVLGALYLGVHLHTQKISGA